MNINATLLGEALMFGIFIWFCMKFVWPPIVTALEKRRQVVADGLEAARLGELALREAAQKAEAEVQAARDRASEIIKSAERTGHTIIEESKNTASEEAHLLLEAAKADISQERNRMAENLRKSFASLTLSAAEKVVRREITAETHSELLQSIVKEL